MSDDLAAAASSAVSTPAYTDAYIYELGSCQAACVASTGGCPATLDVPTRLTCTTAAVGGACTAVTSVLEV